MNKDEAVLSIFDTLVTSSRYPMMPNGNVLRQLMVSYGCWDLLRSLKTRPYANLWSLAWEILFFGSTSAKLKSSRNCCVCGVWLASKAWGRNWNIQNSQAFAVHLDLDQPDCQPVWGSYPCSLFAEVMNFWINIICDMPLREIFSWCEFMAFIPTANSLLGWFTVAPDSCLPSNANSFRRIWIPCLPS